jgi:RimJ/RimL family protein N-acetyltransferase
VETNELEQPVGRLLPGWSPPPAPTVERLEGRYCRLERLDPARHDAGLFEADRADRDGASWTYLPYGPFPDLETYRRWLDETAVGTDPFFFAVVALDRPEPAAVGVLSYLRIDPEKGSIEVGHVHYSPALQRTRAATEAQYLLMRHAFDLGYRRYEWKCDALNAGSRAAAERLGFTFEGVFRQAAVVKGRNRDTAWFSVIDQEWPVRRAALERWLSPDNFDAAGRARSRLGT